MNQILVAIDFSKCAVRALQYAVNMASKINGNIIMIWVDNTKSSETVLPVLNNLNRREIVNNFKELIELYGKNIKERITYKIRSGKVHEEVSNQAKYSDANLIIAGTHGITGFEEFWVGSNAYRIVQYSPVPVITIRANYEIRNTIKNIVLPIDSTLETRQKVPFTASLAHLFNSKIHILSLHSSNISAIKRRVLSYTDQVEKFLKGENLEFVHKEVNTKNITISTVDYAEKINADLIAIMTEQETSTANIFLGTYARQMINHSEIPVLSIHSKEFLVSGSR